MITEPILRLKIAFANIPMKGLFFWEALLFLKDDEYKKIVEENFAKTMSSFPQGENDNHVQEVLEAMNDVRQSILTDPNIKSEVEKIRGVLISETARESVLNSMRKNIIKETGPT